MQGHYSQLSTGLPAKFEEFRQNIELTENQRADIIGSHTHLRQRNLIPLSYVRETFLTGSYKKRTMIRPPDDVDIFVEINYGQGQVTPSSVLSWLKRDLSGAYPSSIVRQDKPCIALDFSHCKFELTPAIPVNYYTDFGYYIPAQGQNAWVQVESPKLLEDRLSSANTRLNGLLVPLIKMMKACKRYNNIDGIKSFEMEDRAIGSLHYVSDYRDGVQKLLRLYNWSDKSRSYWEIESMTDPEFASYCRMVLFGYDFPE